MTDTLTFTATEHDGLRYWDLTGPAGTVRFEIDDRPNADTATITLHGAQNVGPGAGIDLKDCVVCGRGWHDEVVNGRARALRDWWEAASRKDTVIRAGLADWYRSNMCARS